MKYSAKEIRERFERSHICLSSFCRKHDLPYNTFYKWLTGHVARTRIEDRIEEALLAESIIDNALDYDARLS